jgi:hypothetical protein
MNARRNSPCPCGSGRKFKVCCLRNPQNEAMGDFSHGCLLCNGPSAMPSVYVPREDDYKRLGVSEDDCKRLDATNKFRVFVYTLCYDCNTLPNRDDLIDQKVLNNQVPYTDIARDSMNMR